MFAVADAAGARELIVVGFSMAAKFAPAMAVAVPPRALAQVSGRSCRTGPRGHPPTRCLKAGWMLRATRFLPERFQKLFAIQHRCTSVY
jgi:hypothetical protein